MPDTERLRNHFEESITVKKKALETLIPSIAAASSVMTDVLSSDSELRQWRLGRRCPTFLGRAPESI